MAYSESVGKFLVAIIPVATTTSGVLREMDIGAASADHGELLCVRRCKVTRLKFTMTGELAGGSATAPTVVFTRRPTPNSATGEVEVGTLTVPHLTAVGKTVYKDIDPVNLEVGDSLQLAHTIGITGPTGMGVVSVDVSEDPEDARNESDMIESA